MILKCNQQMACLWNVISAVFEFRAATRVIYELRATINNCMFLSCHVRISEWIQWSLSDCNWARTHNHLVHKRTLNHLVKPAKVVEGLSPVVVTINESVSCKLWARLLVGSRIGLHYIKLHYQSILFQFCKQSKVKAIR